jgi:hypothetical protein
MRPVVKTIVGQIKDLLKKEYIHPFIKTHISQPFSLFQDVVHHLLLRATQDRYHGLQWPGCHGEICALLPEPQNLRRT